MPTHADLLNSAGAALYDVLVAQHLDDAPLWNELDVEERDYYLTRAQPVLTAVAERLDNLEFARSCEELGALAALEAVLVGTER